MIHLPFGGSWGHVGPFFAIFRIFFAFFSHLKSSWHFLSIFCGFWSILARFWKDFGSILEDFWNIFRCFFAFLLTMAILWNIAFSLGKIKKIKGWSLKKSTKNQKKSWKNHCKFGVATQRPQNTLKKWLWDGLGLHLGRFWDSLGPLWGTFGRFLVVFLVF
jgi:hypothetical protein